VSDRVHEHEHEKSHGLKTHAIWPCIMHVPARGSRLARHT